MSVLRPSEQRAEAVHVFVLFGFALAQPVFEKLRHFEKIQLGTCIAGRRQALIDAGARLSEHSLGERLPRKGVMQL